MNAKLFNTAAGTALAVALALGGSEEARAQQCMVDWDLDGSIDGSVGARDTGSDPSYPDLELVCGPFAWSDGKQNTVIGAYAKAYAIDPDDPNTGPEAPLSDGVTANYATAVGNQAIAKADATVALGRGALAEGAGAVAIGATDQNQTIDARAVNQDTSPKAASYAVAIGYQTKATGANSVSLGQRANASIAQSIAIGSNARAETAIGAIAIGADASSNAANAVALGYNSIADVANTVSVGRADNPATTNANEAITRKIVHVTDGVVDEHSSEAVTGHQLWELTGRVGTLEITGGGIVATNAATPLAKATVQNGIQNSVALGYGSIAKADNTVSVGKAESSPGAGDGLYREIVNVKAGTDSHNAATVGQMNKAIADATHSVVADNTAGLDAAITTEDGMNSVALGAGSIAETAYVVSVGRSIAVIDDPDTPDINETRAAFTRRITNVSNGVLSETSTDAVTGKQLHKVDQKVGALQGNFGTIASGATNSVALGAGSFVGAGEEDVISVGSSIAVIDDPDTPDINEARDPFTRRITNVSNGALSETSTDAVTGQQLFEVSSNFGEVQSGATGSVALGADSVVLPAQSDVISVGSLGSERKIINVADGTATSDAATVGQLNAYVKTTDLDGKIDTKLTTDGYATQQYVTDQNFATQQHVALNYLSASRASFVSQGNAAKAAGGSSMAIGASAFASSDASVQPQISAGFTGSMAVGSGALAMGNGALAIGLGAAAIRIHTSDKMAENASAVGFSAGATGTNASAFGASADAVGNSSTALGASAKANSVGSIAVGASSEVHTSAIGGIAIGQNALVQIASPNAELPSSMALGTGSLASESGTVSFGNAVSFDANSDGTIDPNEGVFQRRLVNVANPEDDQDAATKRYVDTAIQGLGTGGASAHVVFVTSENSAKATGGVSSAIGDSALATTVQGDLPAVVGSSSKGAQANGAYAVALGENTLAVGTNSFAGGHASQVYSLVTDAVAVGPSSSAAATDATAVGSLSSALGAQSTALGKGATANDTGAIAIGAGSIANASTAASIAIGQEAEIKSGATGSIAIGDHAIVNANIANSVAIGIGSVADAEHTVSVGNQNLQRRLVNVAKGTAPTDAVNKAQLEAALNGLAVGQIPVLAHFAAEGVGTATATVTGAGATALGSGANAGATNAVAVGPTANAGGPGALAFGGSANATGAAATAIGNQSVGTGLNAVALGNNTRANMASTVSIGDAAIASGLNALALGGRATATGSGSMVLGSGSTANRDGAMVVGSNALAQGVNAAAIGNGAIVLHNGSTALGQGARTSAVNQVELGATGSSVAIGDINASTEAQDGQLYMVTVDENGTLGKGDALNLQGAMAAVENTMRYVAAVTDTQFAALSSEVTALGGRVDNLEFQLGDLDESTRGGIATAMAMGGQMIVPDSTISVSVNGSPYRGEQGFAGGITARVAPRVYVSGSIAGSTARKSTGGRVGVAFGF